MKKQLVTRIIVLTIFFTAVGIVSYYVAQSFPPIVRG